MPFHIGTSEISRALVEGINSRTLFQVSEEILRDHSESKNKADSDLAVRANETCRRISEETSTTTGTPIGAVPAIWHSGFCAICDNARIRPSVSRIPTSRRWRRLGSGCWASWRRRISPSMMSLTKSGGRFGKVRPGLYLMAWDEYSTRLRLSWAEHSRRLFEKLRPTPSDFAFAPIPHPVWPLYFGVKPVRVGIEKLTGIRTADRLGLKSGSFSLGTPPALLPGLFEFANVGPEDTFVDLGCGDGRVVIEAAKQFGCRAIGVERNTALIRGGSEGVRLPSRSMGVCGSLRLLCATPISVKRAWSFCSYPAT